MKAAGLCRKHGISDATLYNWEGQVRLEVSDAKRLKALESENAKLKKLQPACICIGIHQRLRKVQHPFCELLLLNIVPTGREVLEDFSKRYCDLP